MQRINTAVPDVSAADGDCANNSTTPDLTGLDVRCEPGSLSTSDVHSFFRFQLLDVYKDAVIDEAIMTVYAYAAAADNFDPRIYIQDINNSPAFGASENLTLRTFWATYVTFTTGAWTAGTAYNTPSIKTLIDYVTGLAGWVPGNYITIKFDSAPGSKGDAARSVRSFDYDVANGTFNRALLTITHTHACNQDNIVGGDWVLNSTYGSCTLLQDVLFKGDIIIQDAQFLNTNGYDIDTSGGSIYQDDSGSQLIVRSGTEVTIEQ